MIEQLHAPLLPFLTVLLADLPPPLPSALLDLGCGVGDKLPLLQASLPTTQIAGLDINNEVLFLARSQGYHWLVCGDGHDLPLADQCFDFVWCCATLGLFAQQERALREVQRILRPSGRLLLVTATQRWALVPEWPTELIEALREALPVPWAATFCDKELASELTVPLVAAGLNKGQVRAWPLDLGRGEAWPELLLADWPQLEALVAERLSDRLLAQGKACWAAAEPQLMSVAVAVLAERE